MKERLKDSGYKYVTYLGDGQHLLRHADRSCPDEIWASNKNHASYGIIYKNTHLEFVRQAP